MSSEPITQREFEEYKENMRRALEIQAREYERRLSDLNHEKEQLKEQQTTYVRLETYNTRNHDVDTQLRALNSFRDNMQGRMIGYSGIVLLIGIAATILLHFLH